MGTPDQADLCFPTLNSSCRGLPQSEPETTIISSLFSAISIMTVVLNLLVIISISHFRQLHTGTNFLLLSLAVSDFLVGSLLMPFQVLSYRGCWLLGDILCVVYVYGGYIVGGVSCWTMVLISIDRYVAVCEPLSYQTKVSIRRVQISICISWVSVIIYCGCFLRHSIRDPGAANTCIGECVFVLNPIEAMVDSLMFFMLPFTTITVLYGRVFVVAVSQAQVMRRQVISQHPRPQQSSRATAKKSQLKAAKTLGFVVLAFLLLNLPIHFSGYFLEYNQVDLSSANAVIWLLYFNSCINPIIYAFVYPWFRKSITSIVTLQILKPFSRDRKNVVM